MGDVTERRALHQHVDVVAAWVQLHDQLAELETPTPCRVLLTRARWISDAPADQEAAAHCCGPCPVLVACRAYAIAAHEPAGVWGATSPAERRASLTGEA